MSSSLVSDEVNQRIRNRIIDYFELLSSDDAIIEYAERAPVNVVHQVFNQWEDWTYSLNETFSAPAYSDAERVSIREFQNEWSAVLGRITHDFLDIYDFINTEQWRRLNDAASRALTTFRIRGRSNIS